MALSQRPAGRFFAAFYRWSWHTQRTPCSQIAAQRADFLQKATHRRVRYHVSTRLWRQSEGVKPRIRENKALEDAEEEVEEIQGERGQEIAPDQEEQDTQEQGARVESSQAEVDPVEDAAEDEVQREARTQALRSLMRRVPSSVVIVTASSTDPTTKAPVPLGTALSSFNTVSLDPPYVSFNIKCPSQTLEAIRTNGIFRVHLLDDHHKSAMIVDAFTRGNTPDAFKQRRHLVAISHKGNKKYVKIKSGNVVAALGCQLAHEVTVADHVVVIAKVRSMEMFSDAESTLLYHDGAYRQNNGTLLPVALKPSTAGKDAHLYWEYPLFPGEEERKDFVNRLRRHIRHNPDYFDMEISQAVKVMTVKLNIPTSAFGVNFWLFMDECRTQAGRLSHRPASQIIQPILSDYWGRLSPSDIASIVERSKKFVQSHSLALDLHYSAFYSFVGVHSRSIGLLASDILEPLRKEGLADPELKAGPNAKEFKHQGTDPPLEALETLEIRLREYYKSGNYETMHLKTVNDLKEELRETADWAYAHLTRVRNRILCEAFPTLFSDKYIDIRGEVSPEEARVVVARVVHAIITDNPKLAYKRLLRPKSETLRTLGIHPMISGIDPDFLFGKITHVIYSTSNLKALTVAADKMTEHLFSQGTLEWDDVITRARKLVQSHTLQVLRWSREDLLAAMGIDARAKIKTPLSNNKPHLLHGQMLPTIFAKELKAYHGKGTPEENEAIAAYLRTNYSYKVKDNSPSSPPPPSSGFNTQDIAAEMKDAMMRNLNLHVSDADKARQEIEEAMKEFGTHRGSTTTGGRKRPTRALKKGDEKQGASKWEALKTGDEMEKPRVSNWEALKTGDEKLGVNKWEALRKQSVREVENWGGYEEAEIEYRKAPDGGGVMKKVLRFGGVGAGEGAGGKGGQ
ncbi:hypothetical protein CC80DRAFT_472182 [Byssothecium circinans]|uniref:Flavin reductase like domain-containing protein n=1 Tax=Byssothecium circinans TaxID=147558 RepID=A0A6A5TY33_9PLEO|nr:hypothetical protein CC80DRAFT_472182 [Byssothecium circinans]